MFRMTGIGNQLGLPGASRLWTTDGSVLGLASQCEAAEPSRGVCNLTFLEGGT